MDLHTDGTYVKEKTDWLLMTKLEEVNVQNGESVLLHLDDWEHLNEMSNDPIGRQNFVWGSPKSKNISYKVEHPVFLMMRKEGLRFLILTNFLSQKIWTKEIFYKSFQISLEGSKNKILLNLPSGYIILANNYFWLHGRRPFKKDKNLRRELLRIRGRFF